MNRSSSVLIEFPWPRLPGCVGFPRWTGKSFMVGSLETEILKFGESESAWSEDLTAMHEAEANSSHPIDLASRRLAVESIARPQGVARSAPYLKSSFLLVSLQNIQLASERLFD